MTLPKLATFATLGEMSVAARRPDYVLDGVIERGAMSLLFGDPASGKSLLALDWSCCIASGRSWLGRTVQQGTVIYIAGEGRGGIGRRGKAWSLRNDAPMEDLPVYVTKYGANFLDPEDVAEMKEEIRRAPPPVAIIVVDTLARATPGMNEDRANEVGAFVEVCDDLRDEFGAAVLVLHHSPHRDKSRAKGSVALKGAVDVELALKRTSREDIVKLVCTKLKDGEPLSDVFLRFQSVDLPTPAGERMTSAVLVQCDLTTERDGKARKSRQTPNDRLFAAALGTEPSPADTVRKRFIEAHGGEMDNAAQNFGRARKRALRRGWFVEGPTGLTPIPEAMSRDGANGQ